MCGIAQALEESGDEDGDQGLLSGEQSVGRVQAVTGHPVHWKLAFIGAGVGGG